MCSGPVGRSPVRMRNAPGLAAIRRSNSAVRAAAVVSEWSVAVVMVVARFLEVAAAPTHGHTKRPPRRRRPGYQGMRTEAAVRRPASYSDSCACQQPSRSGFGAPACRSHGWQHPAALVAAPWVGGVGRCLIVATESVFRTERATMRKWQQVVVGGAVVALLTGGGVALAAGGGGVVRTQAVDPHAKAAPAAAVDTAQESKYTPISPCRIADTRKKGGAIAAGTTRPFFVSGTTGFAPQGGKSGGCGIPAAASAVQVTITAVGATGNGFLKAYPYGASTPNATFLNFTRSFNVSGAGSVKLCSGSCSRDMRIANYGRSTNAVIDVQGYYIPPMFAHVWGDGTLQQHSRVSGVIRTDTGVYQISFDRDVSHCTWNITPSGQFASPNTIPVGGGTGHDVVVQFLSNASGQLQATDSSFYLSATC